MFYSEYIKSFLLKLYITSSHSNGEVSFNLNEEIVSLITRSQNQVPGWTSYDDRNPGDGNPAGYTYTELVHRNSENHVWFCVGYWYFLQRTEMEF